MGVLSREVMEIHRRRLNREFKVFFIWFCVAIVLCCGNVSNHFLINTKYTVFSRLAGSCGCFAVRAVRSPNSKMATLSYRQHFPILPNPFGNTGARVR